MAEPIKTANELVEYLFTTGWGAKADKLVLTAGSLEMAAWSKAEVEELLASQMKPVEGEQCPFCLDDDFDLIGLKAHLSKGYCDTYNDVAEIKSPFSSLPAPTGGQG